MNISRRSFLKRVMKAAWVLARQGAARFGGDVKPYFNIALRLAWEESRPRTVWHPKLGNRFWLPGLPLEMYSRRTRQMYLPGVAAK